jgi:hypothetical protein
MSQIDVGRRRVRCEFATAPSKSNIQQLLASTRLRLEFGSGVPFTILVRDGAVDPLQAASEIVTGLAGAVEGEAVAAGAKATKPAR